MSDRTITSVYHWANGMTMVFDQHGEQMPDYQGPTEEVRERIERDRPRSAQVVSGADWRPVRDALLSHPPTAPEDGARGAGE
jgi:hypothetical protein